MSSPLGEFALLCQYASERIESTALSLFAHCALPFEPSLVPSFKNLSGGVVSGVRGKDPMGRYIAGGDFLGFTGLVGSVGRGIVVLRVGGGAATDPVSVNVLILFSASRGGSRRSLDNERALSQMRTDISRSVDRSYFVRETKCCSSSMQKSTNFFEAIGRHCSINTRV